jgi:hypothetical protein
MLNQHTEVPPFEVWFALLRYSIDLSKLLQRDRGEGGLESFFKLHGQKQQNLLSLLAATFLTAT